MSDETPRTDTDDLAFWRANLVAVLEARCRTLAIEPLRQENRTPATAGECLSLLAIFVVMVGGLVLAACNLAIVALAPTFPHLPAALTVTGCIVALGVASVGLGILEFRRWHRVRRPKRERNV